MYDNIFEKLEKLEPKVAQLEFWKELSDKRYVCKITGRILSHVNFLRHQVNIGAYNIILEVNAK